MFHTLALAAACFTLGAGTAAARDATPANPQVDYAGFVELAARLAPVREAHRLGWADWVTGARSSNAILLDTRSAEAFARGHIRGAVNLPFSDFTDEKLSVVLGADKNRPLYIYCNNNFRDDRPPVALKRAVLALNIPTFVNLHGYGYTNVWELADVVGTGDLHVEWVTGA